MLRLVATRCQNEGNDKSANDVIHNPFRSEKQRKFLWWKYPAIARRWTKKYGSGIHPK